MKNQIKIKKIKILGFITIIKIKSYAITTENRKKRLTRKELIAKVMENN